MYLYYFNHYNGADDTLYISKIIKVDRENTHNYSNTIRCFLDPSNPETLGKLYVYASILEGYVHQRCFWLKEYDPIMGQKIVDTYLENKKNFGMKQARINPFIMKNGLIKYSEKDEVVA